MILVAGATGLVGSAVCEKLAARGERVRALVRGASSAEKTAKLRACGAELVIGDLKDPASLATACRGADAVISTASSTLSREVGDSIETVDASGQLNLVKAAEAAGVQRFVFVSFRREPALPSPLGDAKAAVERALAGMNHTVIQANCFMEIWLSPMLGFDYMNGNVRMYGAGTKALSWVSAADVAGFCAVAVRHPAAARRMIEFGGPEALSPLEVVARFERIAGRKFHVEHVPESALRTQFENAGNSLEKSFAALMLSYALGNVMDTAAVAAEFGLKLTSVDEYARRVLAAGAAA